MNHINKNIKASFRYPHGLIDLDAPGIVYSSFQCLGASFKIAGLWHKKQLKLNTMANTPEENQALLNDFLNWMHINVWTQYQGQPTQVHVDAYLASLE